ncbi:metal ABC transporter permease [Candidatus Dependentiae bacterium]|nr:metal ABC transporter permease [Candidatus Dependentiae bacterium]
MNMQFVLALIMGMFVGGLAGYIGSLMLTRRMSLMGGALGHLALPGIALAMYFKFDISIGALIFLIVGITIIWGIWHITNLPTEAITAVVFPAAMSTTFLFLPKTKTIPALIGDISSITIQSALITIITSLIICIITKKIFKRMVLISISPDIAKTKEINVKKYNFIYLICIAITVALGVRIVGGLMTAALVAIPASTSKNVSKSLLMYSTLSIFLGIISSFIGIIAFKYTNIAAGPLIIISSSSLFLLSLILKKRIK